MMTLPTVAGDLVRGRRRLGERGASATEYALMITGIAAVIVFAVYAFGGGVTSLFDNTCDTLSSQAGAGNC